MPAKTAHNVYDPRVRELVRATGNPVSTWHHRLADWMRQRGLLER